MARVLVVEDNPTVATLLRYLLEKAGHQIDCATHGRDALTFLEKSTPDAIVTDLKMPIMNGLELVEAVRRTYPSIPVILTTGVGSEETAVQALQMGAASYVPKANLEVSIVPTLRNVLAVSSAQKQKQLILEHLSWSQSVFELQTDVGLVTPIVSHVDDMLQRFEFCDEAGRIRLGIALHEALVNAMIHGNLEISSECRENHGRDYSRLLNQRMTSDPYKSRKVFVQARVSREEARFVVRDEGPGFDPAKLPDPTDPAYIDRCCGRGLYLIRTFLDAVSHNASGNEITLVKRRESTPPAA